MAAQGWAYCLRSQHAIGYWKDGCAPRLLIDHSRFSAGKSGFEAGATFLTSPYGLALNEASAQLWISDKHTDTLWCLDWNELQENTDSKLELDRSHAVRVQGGHSPCMLDWQPGKGLLVGCFGLVTHTGGVLQYWGDQWIDWTSAWISDCVTHCCWTCTGGICYVTRNNSILWYQDHPRSAPMPLSSSSAVSDVPPASGDLKQLRLRYVQGLARGHADGLLLLADASLGAIFEIDLVRRIYRVVCGMPCRSDSLYRFAASGDRGDIWLGKVRAVAAVPAQGIMWLSGETGHLFKANGTALLDQGLAVPGSLPSTLAGCGLILV